jgi:glutamyl endopeptidase
MTALTREVVLGEDDRERVLSTSSYPWRCVCALTIHSREGLRYQGTGWLAGPRTVVTAGHCVYMHDGGGWVSKIEVVPGAQSNDVKPFGTCIADSFKTLGGWIDGENAESDLGAILLPDDCRYGEELGHLAFGEYSAQTLESSTVRITGYPSDKPRSTLWTAASANLTVSGRLIEYEIDTSGGQSGSPVWLGRDGQVVVGAVHTSGSSSGNAAVRISGAVYDNLQRWVNT